MTQQVLSQSWPQVSLSQAELAHTHTVSAWHRPDPVSLCSYRRHQLMRQRERCVFSSWIHSALFIHISFVSKCLFYRYASLVRGVKVHVLSNSLSLISSASCFHADTIRNTLLNKNLLLNIQPWWALNHSTSLSRHMKSSLHFMISLEFLVILLNLWKLNYELQKHLQITDTPITWTRDEEVLQICF